jgi:(E)-4-hydroxy-3-methylbut-2-enyl-diphosphate synthase
MIAKIKNIQLGENNEIVIQSMTNLSVLDKSATIEQCRELYLSGCKIIRFATQRAKEIEAIREIKKELQSEFPDLAIVADTHFSPVVAELAAEVFDKVRINPGNFIDRNTNTKIYSEQEFNAELNKIEGSFVPFLQKCKKNNIAIRIGVNHGSLSERMMQKYGDTPEGMVESVIEFLDIAEKNEFFNIVISLKASSPLKMVQANRLMQKRMLERSIMYPLHLGVTEAGNGDEGRIKSAVGIATLLMHGIGDTIRVSLTEAPEKEILPAKLIILASLTNYPKNIFNELSVPEYPAKIPYVVASQYSDDLAKQADYYLNINQIIAYGTEFAPQNSIEQIEIKPSLALKEHKSHDDEIAVHVNIEQAEEWNPELWNNISKLRLILTANSEHYAIKMRVKLNNLKKHKSKAGIILKWTLNEQNWERYIIFTATQIGALLIDNYADGIWLENKYFETNKLTKLSFQILQATQRRQSFPEIISCPGCGRTLFDLEKTVNDFKGHINELKNTKIAIMGCIVNGLGEMADADYALVGAGKNKINIYYKKDLKMKNIDYPNAINELLNLMYKNGDRIQK